MNERIKQLALQAGINIPADTEYNGHIYRDALEKFANLIVKEVESYIQEAEGDIDLVQFLIDRYLK